MFSHVLLNTFVTQTSGYFGMKLGKTRAVNTVHLMKSWKHFTNTASNTLNKEIHYDDNIEYALVPAPSALALIGIAGMIGTSRRR